MRRSCTHPDACPELPPRLEKLMELFVSVGGCQLDAETTAALKALRLAGGDYVQVDSSCRRDLVVAPGG